MARHGTSSARGRSLLALPLLAILVAGCGTTGSSNTATTVTATGSTLSVYLSDPPAVRASPALQDIVRGEELAWATRASAVKNVSLALKIRTGTVSANARAAIANDGVLAYLGEVQSGQSRETVGITNAEDVLELSPSDPVVPSKNDFENESTYGRTFASLPIELTTSPAALNRALPSFARAFRTAYQHAPSADAIEGYDAVWVLLRVISGLGNHANNRTKIVSDVIATLKRNQGKASVPAFTIVAK